MQLTLTALPGLPEIRPGDDLAALLGEGLARAGIVPAPGDVLVLAQKIVSKAEGRAVDLAGIAPSARARELAGVVQKDPRLVELILRESRAVLRAVPGVIVVEDRRGLVLANAGIDASNVAGTDERVLLLPEDPDASAARLAQALGLAVVINDSLGRAWRLGTCGTAIGVAGIPALMDLRGRPDRQGRALQTSELALADEVAAAGSLVMGQADEGRPAVHLRGLSLAGPGAAADLVRPLAKDLFR